MLKKFIAGSALAAAVLTMAAPAASAAGFVSRGTFPNQAAANEKCLQGKVNGWWDGCSFRIANPTTRTVELLTNR
jgi:hypothetical protein